MRNASVKCGVPNPGERLLLVPTEADAGCFDLCATQEYTGFLWLLTWRASSQFASLLEFKRAVLMGAWQQRCRIGMLD